MAEKLHTYEGESIVVTFDAKRCIHAAECVHGLPGVFDPEKRPWVNPDSAEAHDVADIVHKCPTGALKVRTKSEIIAAESYEENTVAIATDGPLFVRGDVEIVNADGATLLSDTRFALCRCGASKNKPFCDGAHATAGFQAPSTVPDPKIRQAETPSSRLKVVVATRGPLVLEGPVIVRDLQGSDQCRGTKTALCRCGESENKPFCDGAHSRIGFDG